jgi:hypothetical protein
VIGFASRDIEPTSDAVKDASDDLTLLFERVAVWDGHFYRAQSDKHRHSASPVTNGSARRFGERTLAEKIMPQILPRCLAFLPARWGII